MFDQGRGFERGEGKEFVIPLMAFFLTNMLSTYSPHTDISHIGGHMAYSFSFFII